VRTDSDDCVDTTLLTDRPAPPRAGTANADVRTGVEPALLHGAVVRSGRRVVVIDDDPTGTQSVADVPIVSQWSVSDLRWALARPTTALFVLTNSRSQSAAAAAQINREVVSNLLDAAADLDVDVAVISRSDSTLRGHFPAETDAIAETWQRRSGRGIDVTLLCPAYPEAGRVTVDDVQWVTEDGERVPVTETEFARDATFGFAHSNLREWIEERSRGRWPAQLVDSISLHDVRVRGPSLVAQKLMAHTDGAPVVVNAEDPSDLDVVAMGVLMAESRGTTVLCRTGPSFVRARAGQSTRPPLSATELREATGEGLSEHGLLVVGSHVQLTTRQVLRAAQLGGFVEVDVDVSSLLDPVRTADAVAGAVESVVRGMLRGDVLLRTSRELVTGSTPDESLVLSRIVADHLARIVADSVAQAQPRWVIGKGGITASDVVTRGLGMRRAWVLGQMLPGRVSAWSSASNGEQSQPLGIIFPGNVGDDDSVANVVARLRSHTDPAQLLAR
jgi:uncharacterized protein YgbK (DUF1537 family)